MRLLTEGEGERGAREERERERERESESEIIKRGEIGLLSCFHVRHAFADLFIMRLAFMCKIYSCRRYAMGIYVQDLFI